MICEGASSPPIEVRPPTALDRCTMCGIYRALSVFVDRPWNESYCVDRYACFRRGELMKPPAKPELPPVWDGLTLDAGGGYAEGLFWKMRMAF